MSMSMDHRQENKKILLDKLQSFDIDRARSSQVSQAQSHHFDNYHEYLLSLIGFAVGFGSFWRFPYLVYKNGGGAFLIPYFAAIFLLGMPMLYLQTATGQMHQCSTPFIFGRINRGYKMLGVAFLLVCYHLSGYYNLILAYSYRYIFTAFINPLPFSDQSPFQNKYFTEEILHASPSISQFGTVHPFLFILFAFSLFVCYMIVKNGVKTSGKIVVVTSLLPYALFIVLAIRGLFLSGAIDGIKYLLIPDFKKLFAVEIWIDAVVQVFYQMSVAVGGIINMSSLKPRREKHLLGLYMIPLSIVICGMLSALNIFMYLGHFCLEQNISITELTLSGPSLSFNIFPKALAILPLPNLWVLIFFVTMVFLGIDSEFGYIQTCFCYLKDQVRQNQNGLIRILGRDYEPQNVKIAFICFIMVFCPFLTSSAGIYYLEYFDRFVATIPLSLGAIINYIFFVHIIPFEELEKQSLKYTGQVAPKWIKNLLQGRIVIIILILNLFLAVSDQFFSFYRYPFKFYLFGWIITAYPYILAYIYYKKYKQDKTYTTFAEFKQPRLSQL